MQLCIYLDYPGSILQLQHFAATAESEDGCFRSLAAPISSNLAAASEHAASDREELNHIFLFSPSQMHRFELN